jgi:hypothetical protein
MIDRHWDGIAAYCRPENKVSLGFVEGLNNKIRVIQRRAYGLADENYLRGSVERGEYVRLFCVMTVIGHRDGYWSHQLRPGTSR